MIFAWTPEVIAESLSALNPKQRAALELSLSESNVGPARLKKSGFSDAEEFWKALESARSHVKTYFAIRGIHKVGDLEFAQQGRSNEGRIQEPVGKLGRNSE